MFELYVYFYPSHGQTSIRLGDEPTKRKAMKAAIARCADDHVRVVKIYKGATWIDTVSGEAVRINNARKAKAPCT